MNKGTCRTCIHYYQHYALNERRFFRVYCGHCPFKKSRKVTPDTKACEHYEFSPSTESAFVTKEYLSKALLTYILQLDLLPEIEDF